MSAQVVVYPDGHLLWEAHASESVGSFAEGTFSICFLNEPRVRNASFEVLHYLLDSYWDDGPPSLEQVVEGCRLIEEQLQAGHKVRVFCPEGDKYNSHRCFSALCTAAHPILVRGESTKDIASKWASMKLGFFPWSWASNRQPAPSRLLSLETCLEALELARKKGWLDINSFDVAAWRERWHKYDVTWVVPKEIQVMADPMSTIVDPDPSTVKYLTSEDIASQTENPLNFASMFKADGVSLLVRCNLLKEPGLERSYDPSTFAKHGIDHLEAAYDDVNGGVPSSANLSKVIQKCSDVPQEQAICFHCKAGFGRSGFCAAVLTVFRYDVPGELVLAWERMCRPGSITTWQQYNFLKNLRGRIDVEKKLNEPACCSVL